MDKQAITDELTGVIGGYLQAKGFDLVDLIYRHEKEGLFLRLFIDRPCGGIDIDECAYLNKEIGLMLDEKAVIQDEYILEVSSPGLDRPLRAKNDFSRCLNKKVKFFLREPVNGKIEWDGVITKVDDEYVYADVKKAVLNIALSKINKAKQIIE